MKAQRFDRSRPIANCKSQIANGFTLVELLVALAIIALVLASVIPYIMAKREASHRVTCMYNLSVIRDSMALYRKAYGSFPRTRFDPQNTGWTCYTGADDANPFVRESGVQPNDVTAALWLLVREGYITDTSVFVCPSTNDVPDRLYDANGKLVDAKQRGNFRSSKNLSYSIVSPYNQSPGFEWNDLGASEFVLLADKNPGINLAKRSDVTKPKSNDPPEMQGYANSLNHGRAGQNVLYSYNAVEFVPSAFRGSGFRRANPRQGVAEQPGDNIYTTLQRTIVPEGERPAADANGYFGRDIGPAWQYDSYLLPSAQD
jgi:prepilin-type N-terminal cleavage/methylation domain-containing protein